MSTSKTLHISDIADKYGVTGEDRKALFAAAIHFSLILANQINNGTAKRPFNDEEEVRTLNKLIRGMEPNAEAALQTFSTQCMANMWCSQRKTAPVTDPLLNDIVVKHSISGTQLELLEQAVDAFLTSIVSQQEGETNSVQVLARYRTNMERYREALSAMQPNTKRALYSYYQLRVAEQRTERRNAKPTPN